MFVNALQKEIGYAAQDVRLSNIRGAFLLPYVLETATTARTWGCLLILNNTQVYIYPTDNS